MFVARSFKYTDRPSESRRTPPRSVPPPPTTTRVHDKESFARPPAVSPTMHSEPVAIRSSKSKQHTRQHAQPSTSQSPGSMPSTRSTTLPVRRKQSSRHDPSALPPSVAALLAVTSIPPRRPNRYRSNPARDRRISIEELVSEWKSDGLLKQSYSSSPALSVLLEDVDYLYSKSSSDEPSCYLNSRSASSDSMPSLTSDDRSVMSIGSPPTPGSLRSRKSSSNLKREKARSLPAVEDSSSDHPLVPQSDSEDEELLLPVQKKTPASPKSGFFKSNLTLSLQSLKNSISSLARSSNTPPQLPGGAAPSIDHMLWSHPFLFPRFSSEIRPATDSNTSEAQRRYLNPVPLTFEEWEAPFQQALHAPYLAEAVVDAPTIQMQTYNRSRGRGRGGSKRGSPNPSSEAGRALLGPESARQREVRENSDFLRVVVLEMNMRREGKLETGRAKIWLPPREVSPAPSKTGRVPKRWVGVSAY
ncbi:unnamed protein product [Zymoseptoria tritici ST99CH_3D7]|uniref:Uncharacterized protein n=2 Tax=Zymoseptoria tritici TaxID=1047171 RepID=A0A1X7RKZ0_ZYMT9|nr:unnamed protein product [Zymoseptoria tritici ST99CH_3D7]